MSIQQIKGEKSWTEVTIDENCDFGIFYNATEVLQDNFEVSFSNYLNDFDTLYLDFWIDGAAMTLHYNVFLGLSLYPTSLHEATEMENLAVMQLGLRLKEILISRG